MVMSFIMTSINNIAFIVSPSTFMNTRVSVLLINVASTSFKVISPVSGSSDQTKSPTSISSISTNPSSVKTNVSSVKQFPKHNFLFLLSLALF